ncbi:hypothetical protein [Marinobacter xestospongiae]|uniref:Uncharacterized protein n=1 Tax=Marinobacter xestospongiae TaxID=994319 RepID=A0ABU3W2S6_9GAMM|nr:hypothetical protein [Marinobacter xestospongiae]MDV2080271.1 hypothetical protein [Marinobacter xestospongiae]
MGALLLFLTIALFPLAALSTFLFSRQTMVRIERDIRKDGLARPSGWDDLGLRLHWYAFALMGSGKGKWAQSNEPFIDVAMIRRYATRADRIRAAAFLISSYLFVFTGISTALTVDF